MAVGNLRTLLADLGVASSAMFAGLIALESSFPVTRLKFEAGEPRDWNPLKQIPFCYRGYASGALLSAAYDERYKKAHQVVELSHEMLHILLWESFFVGDVCPSEAEFVELSRAFEGYAYWFADIAVTEELRKIFPKNEVLFSRHSLTSLNFHPGDAFRELGILDPKQIKKVYLDTFMGRGARGASFPKSHRLAPLFRGLENFYSESAIHLRALYRALQASGTFTAFWLRFCAIPDLPRMMDRRFDSGRAARRMIEEGNPLGVFSRQPEILNAVKVRRELQIRAYTYMQVRHCVETDGLLRKPGSRLSPAWRREVVKKLDLVLTELERYLRALAEGASIRVIRGQLRKLDITYEKTLRCEFLKVEGRVARRNVLLTDDGYLGLAIDLNRNDRAAIKRMRRLYDSLTVNLLFSAVASNRTFLKNHELIVRTRATNSSVYRALIKNLTSEVLISRWTVSLDAVSPTSNSFPEINHFFT